MTFIDEHRNTCEVSEGIIQDEKLLSKVNISSWHICLVAINALISSFCHADR